MKIGIVAENSIIGSENEIVVVPIEEIPNVKGKLESIPHEIQTSGVDKNGVSYQDNIITTSTVTALWGGGEANRITAPQLRKGDRVELFQQDGQNTYYWRVLNQQMNNRHRESVVFAYAAKSKDTEKDIVKSDHTNCYTHTVDATMQQIEFRMSMDNGEKCAWLFQMDANHGVLTLTDQFGNVIDIDHVKTTIRLENRDKSQVILNKKTINIIAPDTINIKAGDTINMQAKTINVKCDTKNLSASNVKYDISGQFTVNCPQSTFNGKVAVGSISTGAGGGGGGASIAGSLDVQGSTSIKGSVSLNGGTSNGVIKGSWRC